MTKMHALFIDDDDISSIIGRLTRRLGKNGITLISDVFDLKNYKVQSVQDEKRFVLDEKKIKQDLTAQHLNKRYDLVACDFNFLDEKLNGFKLIKWAKNQSNGQKYKIRNAKFVLYSSEKDKSVNAVFSENDVGDLVRLKLEDFLDRDRVSEEAANILFKAGRESTLEQKLISELNKFGNFEFKSVYPKFKGKKIAEIVVEIEKETHHGVGFRDNLIELSVAHMIELNS